MIDCFQKLTFDLQVWLDDAGCIVIAGIGNPIRSDDHVGVRTVGLMKGRVEGRVHLIECETVPESFIDEIVAIRPTHVLLIDAALIGLGPGEVRLSSVEEVSLDPPISTHTLPVKVFSEYVRIMTGAKVGFILVQPKDVSFGEKMTGEVERSAQKIADILIKTVQRPSSCPSISEP